MKILFVGRTAAIGGGSTFRYNAGRGLIERGHQIWVLAWPGAMVARYRAAGIGYCWAPPAPLSAPWIVQAIRRYGIDLVHASNMTPAQAAAWACRRTGVPLVISVHNAIPRRQCRRYCLELARKVIAFDEVAEARLHRYHEFIAPEKIARLPRPIEHHPALPPEAPPFRIVYIGRLSSRKGQLALDLIRATRELARAGHPVELTILGDGTLLRAVRREALASEGAMPPPRVLGRVLEPLPHLRQAHVVVGAGYAALEAAMCGAAVVGAGFKGYGPVDRDSALHARGCNFGDTGGDWSPTPENFRATLERLIAAWSDPAERERYWRLDRVLAPIHAIPAVAAQLEALYQEAVSG